MTLHQKVTAAIEELDRMYGQGDVLWTEESRDSLSQLLRGVREHLTDPTIDVWETEDGEIVVWGTHDVERAKAAFESWAADTIGDASDIEQHFAGQLKWGHPLLPEIEVWPDELVSDVERPGWTPWFIVGGYL